MKGILNKLKQRSIYSIESIKNRYPCRIIDIKYIDDTSRHAEVTYSCATRLNVRTSTIEDLLDDKVLIEKFHPSDCIKLGFISAGEILVKNTEREKRQSQFFHIARQMIEKVSA